MQKNFFLIVANLCTHLEKQKLLTDKELFEKIRKLAYKYRQTGKYEDAGVLCEILFTQYILSKK